MANECSRGYGQATEAAAMRSPVKIAEGSPLDGSFTGEFGWRSTIKRSMNTVRVTVRRKILRLPHKIVSIPKEHPVEKFSTKGCDKGAWR